MPPKEAGPARAEELSLEHRAAGKTERSMNSIARPIEAAALEKKLHLSTQEEYSFGSFLVLQRLDSEAELCSWRSATKAENHQSPADRLKGGHKS